jgi:hypothetical protein
MVCHGNTILSSGLDLEVQQHVFVIAQERRMGWMSLI